MTISTHSLDARTEACGVTLPRSQSEAPLHQADRFHNTFDRAAVGIFQTTPAGRFLRANRALAQLLGYDSPGNLQDAISDVGHEVYVDRRRRDEFLRIVNTNGAVMSFETEVYRKNGETVWIAINAWAVRNAEGDILYYEGFIEDISARRLDEHGSAASESNGHRAAPASADVIRSLHQVLEEAIGPLDRLSTTPLSPQQHRLVREARVATEKLAALIDRN